jgi:hypothetical protein
MGVVPERERFALTSASAASGHIIASAASFLGPLGSSKPRQAATLDALESYRPDILVTGLRDKLRCLRSVAQVQCDLKNRTSNGPTTSARS